MMHGIFCYIGLNASTVKRRQIPGHPTYHNPKCDHVPQTNHTACTPTHFIVHSTQATTYRSEIEPTTELMNKNIYSSQETIVCIFMSLAGKQHAIGCNWVNHALIGGDIIEMFIL